VGEGDERAAIGAKGGEEKRIKVSLPSPSEGLALNPLSLKREREEGMTSRFIKIQDRGSSVSLPDHDPGKRWRMLPLIS